MDNIDKRLLNLAQSSFPVIKRPFDEIAGKLNITEKECIERLKALKNTGIIRQISAIFDTGRLGYTSSLIAMKVKEDRADESAEVINKHPGVSHNYLRDNKLNIWFTIAVPPYSDIDSHINKLSRLAVADVMFKLPTLKLYKIGVKFNMLDTNISDEESLIEKKGHIGAECLEKYILNKEDYRIIYHAQDNIPLVNEPFKDMAENAGLSQEKLIKQIELYKNSGIMRRFAAILRHKDAGYNTNAMVVWRVHEGKADEAGNILASFKAVSHCYKRPVFPDWPYAVYSMVHSRSVAEFDNLISKMSIKTGLTDFIPIYTLKEYKKIRLKYFNEDIGKWEQDNL